MFLIEKVKRCKVGDRLVITDAGLDCRWVWSRSPALGTETTQLLQLQGFTFSSSMDKWVWELNEEREYTVKSFRKLLEHNRTPADLNPMKWSHWISLKVKSIIWNVRPNKIPRWR